MDKDIDKRLQGLEDDMKKILFIMESNSKLNLKGLVEKVNDNHKRLELLELERKLSKARAGIIGAIGGAIVVLASWIAKAFIDQNVK